MAATQTPAVGDGRGSTSPTAGHHEDVDTLDKPADYDPDVLGAYGLEYDGPRCAGDDCRTPVDNDGELCDDCGDQPHEFVHDGSRFDSCVCGRIRAIGGYSPVHNGWADQ